MQLTLPDELVERLEAAAQAKGKTLEEWLGETVEPRTDEQYWEELLCYGQDRGRAASFSEEQSATVVHQWRQQQTE